MHWEGKETSFKKVKNLERNVTKLLSNKFILKENYEEVLSFDLSIDRSMVHKIDNCKKYIKDLFIIDYGDLSWKDCDQIIFSKDSNVGGLLSIDLNSFKISSLSYAPKIGAYCHACKIDKDNYFFHGGRLGGNSHRNETYIININERNFELLKNGPGMDAGGGTVLKNNKIYMFGGFNGSNVNICQYYDLQTKDWKSIHSLLKTSHGVSAAILNKEIILSGYNDNCLYSYNELAYTSILPLPENTHKLICEGWVFANSILYENKEQNNSKWISANISNTWNSYLWVYSIFKKKEIYTLLIPVIIWWG